MNQIIKFILFAACVVQKSSQTLPSGFTTCKSKDPNFGKCLDSAIENGIKLIKDGIPEYNLVPLDPFTLPSLKVGAGTGAVHLVQNYQDIVISGFADVTINNSHVDFDKKLLSFSSMHPELSQRADYDINGKILMLPVHGKGPSTLALESCYTNHKIQFEEKTINNDVYYIPQSYFIKLHPKHARYIFENLFDGNKLLGDNINRLINDEWLTIFEDVAEGYEKAYAQIFLQYVKSIFEKTPVKEIFLE